MHFSAFQCSLVFNREFLRFEGMGVKVFNATFNNRI